MRSAGVVDARGRETLLAAGAPGAPPTWPGRVQAWGAAAGLLVEPYRLGRGLLALALSCL